jgi:hypothetical protein
MVCVCATEATPTSSKKQNHNNTNEKNNKKNNDSKSKNTYKPTKNIKPRPTTSLATVAHKIVFQVCVMHALQAPAEQYYT